MTTAGTGYGQTSKLFSLFLNASRPFFFLLSLYFPILKPPQCTQSPFFPLLVSPLNTPQLFLHNLKMLSSLNPTIYLITLIISLTGGKVLWRAGSDDSSWWVSCAANKADEAAGTALGAAWAKHSFLGRLQFGFCLQLCPCALLNLWRRTFDGMVSLQCEPGNNKDRLLNKLLFLCLFLSAFLFGCRWASHHLI